jgi:hypothetical protein
MEEVETLAVTKVYSQLTTLIFYSGFLLALIVVDSLAKFILQFLL